MPPYGSVQGLQSNIQTEIEDLVITGASEHTVLVDASGGPRTVTLPAASSSNRRILRIKKIDASTNTVTVEGNLSETIDGTLSAQLIAQWEVLTVHCDGTAWFIL